MNEKLDGHLVIFEVIGLLILIDFLLLLIFSQCLLHNSEMFNSKAGSVVVQVFQRPVVCEARKIVNLLLISLISLLERKQNLN